MMAAIIIISSIIEHGPVTAPPTRRICTQIGTQYQYLNNNRGPQSQFHTWRRPVLGRALLLVVHEFTLRSTFNFFPWNPAIPN